MGMTVNDAITILGLVEAHGICIEAKDIAVEIMRKYQKIEQIYSDYLKYMNPDNLADRLGEVLEDGNDI